MPEYIERQTIEKAKTEIVDRMQEFRDEWKRYSESSIDYHNGRNDGMEVGQRIVKAVLTDVLDNFSDDVVNVVRCRNCKHHHSKQEPCHGKTEHFCSVLNTQVFPDFYCYHGKRKENNNAE